MNIPDHVDFADWIKLYSDAESQKVLPSQYWMYEVIDLAKNGIAITGDSLPWSKTDDKLRLRPGELSIWAGSNGHKKSLFVGFVMLHLARQQRVAIASLEMKPEQTLYRMCRQAAGCHPSEQFIKDFLGEYWDRILIYDQLDKVAQERILGFVHYCAMELGCTHIVIDSLTKCGIASADYDAEKSFIDRLQWAAKTLGCHIHLVCHVRKPHGQGEEYIPNKFDVRGAGEITDLVDNVFICWKNKEKETLEKLRDQGATLNDVQQSKLEQSDQKLIVAKQRHGEWEGTINFWFHDASLQFVGNDHRKPIPFTLGDSEAAA